jgi:pyruvate kinase
MRKTKIVATIGPASNSEERLEALVRAGMDVARLNFSHGDHQEHAAAFQAIRAVSARLGRAVGIMQDLSGPKIRTGALQGGQTIALVDGAEIAITTRPVVGDVHLLATTYPHLADDLHPGDRVLLADGLMELTVLSSGDGLVRCRVVHGGLLGEHKGINLPGVRLSAPAVTEKDADDLAFGVSLGVDYVAVSFVRQAEDLREVRRLLRERHADIPVIAKIEKPEAVRNLDAILGACEGVMVARGDLGVEVSPEKVPMLQKQIIEAANRHGALVITATQMLESMVSNPRPTRAEASDVANAILDGTDAVMLSAETAVGQYPVETVGMMSRIALEAEASGRAAGPIAHSRRGYAQAIAHAACTIAGDLDFKAICAFTQSGATARLVSKERPTAPILAFTNQPRVLDRLALLWGVEPLPLDFAGDTDALIRRVEAELLNRGLAAAGDSVIVLGGSPLAAKGATNFLKVQKVSAGS